MELVTPNGRIGTPHWRVEGVAKVTGKALYGADQRPVLGRDGRARQSAGEHEAELVTAQPMAHAAALTSSIAAGRIERLDDSAARAMSGVLEILTHKNVGKRVKAGKPMMDHGYMSQAVAPLETDRIFFSDQVVALVIAETEELASEAAAKIEIAYKADDPSGTFDNKGAVVVKPKSLGETELNSGDLKKAFAEASVGLDAWYETPPQHHNPIELFQTTCAWRKTDDGDEELIVWESTQNARGFQYGIAQQLGLKPTQVRVLTPFIGGAFGSKGELGQFTALVAFGARTIGRPVKFVGSRRQGFSLRTFRAETRHHIRLCADRDGKLLGLDHESWELTSRTEKFATAGSDSTSRLYGIPNVRTLVHNVETDRQAPGFMRAPPEMPYLFAMESAMDELSYALGLDPVELRRRNDSMVELATNRPYTSRSLLRCIERGVELFGWDDRSSAIRSMGDEDDFIGWGYATAFYPTQMGPAHCRITLETVSDGAHAHTRATAEVGTHEIGTGIRTVVTMTVADLLGLPLEAVEARIGDSQLPPAPLSAGSNSTATICSVLAKCCEEIREKLAKATSATSAARFTSATQKSRPV